VEQWRLVFFIAAANSIVGGIIYIMLGTSKKQPWNQYTKLNLKEQEMQNLAPKNVKCDNDDKNVNDIEKLNFIEDNYVISKESHIKEQ